MRITFLLHDNAILQDDGKDSFFFSYNKSAKINGLFFSNFLQSSFSDRYFISSELYSFIHRLIFVILWATVAAHWKHLLSLLLIVFIHLHHNKLTQTNIKLLLLIDVFHNIWNIERSESKSFSINSSALLSVMTYISSLFEYITCSSLIGIVKRAIVSRIFHLPDYWRLFMMSFKFDLILSRHSSIGRPLFLSLVLSYLIYFLFQKLPTLTGL